MLSEKLAAVHCKYQTIYLECTHYNNDVSLCERIGTYLTLYIYIYKYIYLYIYIIPTIVYYVSTRENNMINCI